MDATSSPARPSYVRVYNKGHVDALLADGGAPLPGAVNTSLSRGHTSRTGGGGSAFSHSSFGGTRTQVSPKAKGRSPRHASPGRGSPGKDKKRKDARTESRHAMFLAQQVKEQNEAAIAVREKLIARQRQKDLEFETMYRNLVKGHELTSRIGKMLDLHDTQERQKAEAMFSDWEDKVFGPINDGIVKELDKKSHAAIAAKRRKEYQKFIDSTNGTAGLFLDIVMEGDYDPFAPNRKCVKVKLEKGVDPVKRIITKTEEEKTMIDPSVQKELDAQRGGRETLDVRQWHTGKIEATPHGHFAHMMEDHGPSAAAQKMTKSTVHFDHYNVPKGHEVMVAEYPRGKRTLNQIREHAKVTGHIIPQSARTTPRVPETDAAAAASAGAGSRPATSASVRSGGFDA